MTQGCGQVCEEVHIMLIQNR